MKFNLEEIDKLLGENYWKPIEVVRINDFVIRAMACKGEYYWHSHDEDDEGLLVMRGTVTLDMPDQSVVLNAGEGFMIPKGVKHRPQCKERAIMFMIEPRLLPYTKGEPA